MKRSTGIPDKHGDIIKEGDQIKILNTYWLVVFENDKFRVKSGNCIFLMAEESESKNIEIIK